MPCAHPLKMTLVTFSRFSKFAYIDANSLIVVIIIIIIMIIIIIIINTFLSAKSYLSQS